MAATTCKNCAPASCDFAVVLSYPRVQTIVSTLTEVTRTISSSAVFRSMTAVNGVAGYPPKLARVKLVSAAVIDPTSAASVAVFE
jgi:hypothetical protein